MAQPSKRTNLPLPEKYALSGTETAHQISLFIWSALPEVRSKYPELRWLFAIPNGGSRHKAEAGKFKAMGLKAGAPDICLPIRRGPWPALWIELKRPPNRAKALKGGVTSQEQLAFIEHLKSQNHAAMIAIGWEMARDSIIQYLEWKR